MKRVLIRLMMVISAGMLLAGMFFLSCPAYSNPTQNTEINVWRKVSTDELNPGEIVSLDMSKGYSACEGPYMYIVVRGVDSEEEFTVVFPNGGYWIAPEPDPFLQELQKEFDSLEDYLKNQESKEIKKK